LPLDSQLLVADSIKQHLLAPLFVIDFTNLARFDSQCAICLSDDRPEAVGHPSVELGDFTLALFGPEVVLLLEGIDVKADSS
jgi:hypothetical protein